MIENEKLRELDALRLRVHQLEAEIAGSTESRWPPTHFYADYYATTGFLLGMFGAAASLLANVIGAPVAGKSPLELIRVYLTFPLGAKALQLANGPSDISAIGDGLILAIGSCLYLGTGMLLGVPFFCTLVRLTDGRSLIARLFVASVLAIGLWMINFWGILSWLQPMLFGGNWITDPAILPPWVGVMTHLIFGWTLALLYPWVRFQPYQQPSTAE